LRILQRGRRSARSAGGTPVAPPRRAPGPSSPWWTPAGCADSRKPWSPAGATAVVPAGIDSTRDDLAAPRGELNAPTLGLPPSAGRRRAVPRSPRVRRLPAAGEPHTAVSTTTVRRRASRPPPPSTPGHPILLPPTHRPDSSSGNRPSPRQRGRGTCGRRFGLQVQAGGPPLERPLARSTCPRAAKVAPDGPRCSAGTAGRSSCSRRLDGGGGPFVRVRRSARTGRPVNQGELTEDRPFLAT